jgi:hypothetical protein
MKVKNLIIMMMFAGVMLSSCDRDELFEREQYKHVIALLNDDNVENDEQFNVFAEEHDLAAVPVSQGYVSVICGGSMVTDRDINVSIIEDDELLAAYNLARYDIDESKYARRLPYDKYDIASYNIKIPAGERIGLMDIKVRPTGLSPDSVYFLPLSIERFSTYELNPAKSSLLYRVYMKNFYATNKSVVYYNTRGNHDGINVVGVKAVTPVGGNSVKIDAGSLSSSANDIAIVLTVDKNNKVRIESWKNLKVTQVDGDPEYPNSFLIFDDGYTKYKTFLLNYTYVYNGELHSMREELKLEYDEKKDK